MDFSLLCFATATLGYGDNRYLLHSEKGKAKSG